jgi:hypothetical protein
MIFPLLFIALSFLFVLPLANGARLTSGHSSKPEIHQQTWWWCWYFPTLCPSTPPDNLCPPTEVPTKIPTISPTVSPSKIPTIVPIVVPSATPTHAPTASPTVSPTQSPTRVPTATPSATPTKVPTLTPTASPTQGPSASPTNAPTGSPSTTPSKIPTVAPTANPTKSPSATPTKTPSAPPTAECYDPSAEPTNKPTVVPTVNPTVAPSVTPSVVPSNTPTRDPTAVDTVSPTSTPSSPPTTKPEVECHDGELPTSVPSPAPSQTEKNDDDYYSYDSECHETSVCITTVWTISGVRDCELSSLGQSALLQTVANLLSVSLSEVQFVRIVDSVPTESTMRIEITITLDPMELGSEFHGSSTKVYEYVNRVLTESCSSTFTGLLRVEAQALHAEELGEAIVSVVTVSLCAESETPSVAPSEAPSEVPSQTPSVTPSVIRSDVPSAVPSMTPSVIPTINPTLVPTVVPSLIVAHSLTPTRTSPIPRPTRAPVALCPTHLQYKGIFKIKIKSLDDWTNSCNDNLVFAIILVLQDYTHLQNVEHLGFRSTTRRLDTAAGAENQEEEIQVTVQFTFNLDKLEDSNGMYTTSTISMTDAVATRQLDAGYYGLGEDKNSTVISVQFEGLQVNSADSSSETKPKAGFSATNIAILVGLGVFILSTLVLIGFWVYRRWFVQETPKSVSLKMDGSRDTIKPEDFVAVTIMNDYREPKADDSSYMEDNFIHRHGLKLTGSLDAQS